MQIKIVSHRAGSDLQAKGNCRVPLFKSWGTGGVCWWLSFCMNPGRDLSGSLVSKESGLAREVVFPCGCVPEVWYRSQGEDAFLTHGDLHGHPLPGVSLTAVLQTGYVVAVPGRESVRCGTLHST